MSMTGRKGTEELVHRLCERRSALGDEVRVTLDQPEGGVERDKVALEVLDIELLEVPRWRAGADLAVGLIGDEGERLARSLISTFP